MIFVLIIIVFIGLNYLLWERETRERNIKNLQEINAGNSITINTLNRQLENLNNALALKEENIRKLEEENSNLKKQIDKLNQDIIKTNNTILQKNILINYLYGNLKSGTPETVIKKWAEYINNKDYISAYHTWYPENGEQNETLEEFTSKYEGIIDNIKIDLIELYSGNFEEFPANELMLEGDLFFLVKADVRLREEAADNNAVYEQGENNILFALKYNNSENNWYIAALSPVE